MRRGEVERGIYMVDFLPEIAGDFFFYFRLSGMTLSCFWRANFWSTEEVLMHILILDVIESFSWWE